MATIEAQIQEARTHVVLSGHPVWRHSTTSSPSPMPKGLYTSILTMQCCKQLGPAPFRASYEPHIPFRAGPRGTARSHRRADRRLQLICNASTSIAESLEKVKLVKDLSATIPSIASSRAEPRRFPGDTGDRVGIIINGDAPQNGVVLAVPEDVAITSVDAENHELVGPVAAQCSELVGLTLWLCAERAKGSSSAYSKLMSTLPVRAWARRARECAGMRCAAQLRVHLWCHAA